MLTLFEIQKHFAKAVFSENHKLNQAICDNGLSSDRRLQIYRHNVFNTFTDTLRALYPSILRLVGDEFFDGIAHHYIRNYPSVSGDLHHYGQDFARFLADFPPVKSLPYLPELAQLEWGYHQVFHAADSEPLDSKKLARVPEKQYNAIKFYLHPASKLFMFRYPIFHIWQLSQKGNESENIIELSQGGVNLFIIRRKLEVEFEIVSAGDFALLSAFAESKTFADACHAALIAEPHFNIAESFKQHILRGTIVDFSLVKEKCKSPPGKD